MTKLKAIAGTMGAGKTTAIRELSKCMRVAYEPKSPYLKLFYKNPKNWSFHMQVWMMQHRTRQAKKLISVGGGLQDRTLFEDKIFQAMLHEQGNMSDTEYKMCNDLYQRLILEEVPDTIIYLRVSAETSIARVRERDRPAEREVSDEYLKDLHRRYEDWAYLWETYRDDSFVVVDWDEPDMNKLKGVLDGTNT